MLLRARAVLPITQAIIEDGALLIRNGRIQKVGRWRSLKNEESRGIDLGDTLVLPGLVNAHCHLDYTLMAGMLPPPKKFTDWLKQIVTSKAEWNLQEYRESWLAGADMLVRNGTTTVADIETIPELLPEAWSQTPLRVLSFLEMIGITGRRTPQEILQEALKIAQGLPRNGRCQAHLSPHAPYSTLPGLLELVAETVRRKKVLISTHIAESRLEYQMFSRARGEMHVWLRRSGRDMSDCGKGSSPVKHYARCGLLGEHVIAAHVNYLGREDAGLLGDAGVHVSHCPRSHEYFKHHRFPWRRLRRAGVNICLGTDSLASVVKQRHQPIELNMFEEMRTLARNEPAIPSRHILRMATVNGARALGLAGKVGELTQKAYADLIALPFYGSKRQVYDAALSHTGNVRASMVQGRWAIPPE